MENLATAFLGLSREERSLLNAIESGMKAHEWVPSSIISDISGLPARKVDFLLGRLFEKKLVERDVLHGVEEQAASRTVAAPAAQAQRREKRMGMSPRVCGSGGAAVRRHPGQCQGGGMPASIRLNAGRLRVRCTKTIILIAKDLRSTKASARKGL